MLTTVSSHSSGVHSMRKLVKTAYVVMPVTYIICLLVAFLKCIPFEKQWQIYPDPGSKLSRPMESKISRLMLTEARQTTVSQPSLRSRRASSWRCTS